MTAIIRDRLLITVGSLNQIDIKLFNRSVINPASKCYYVHIIIITQKYILLRFLHGTNLQGT